MIPGTENLMTYKRIKLLLADQLRIVREGLTALERNSSERKCEELTMKLAEDRFSVAVVGLLNSGKSSLINAIIGRDILPSGVSPFTSVTSILRYCSKEHYFINYSHSVFPEELPLVALQSFITENGNPSNVKQIKNAYLEVKVPFLRHDLEIWDFPGIQFLNTTVVEEFLVYFQKFDAVLFVTSVDNPFTALEQEFLYRAQRYVDKIFFVVNKTDLLTENETEQAITSIRRFLQEFIGTSEPEIFPLSAYMGLAGSQSGDLSLNEKSGIDALKIALDSFLPKKKTTLFLISIAQQMLKILEEEAFPTEIEPNITLPEKEKAIKLPDRMQAIGKNSHSALKKIQNAKTKLISIYSDLQRNDLTKWLVTKPATFNSLQNSCFLKPSVSDLSKITGHITEDLMSSECPVCRHTKKIVSEFFIKWQYELGTEETARKRFADELGFCPFHTWQLLSVSSAHGASVGFSLLSEAIATRIYQINNSGGTGKEIKKMIHDSGNCRMCRLLQESGDDYIQQLAMFIFHKEGQQVFSHSQGVCLPHLGMLLDKVESENCREFILSHELQVFVEYAEDMRSFALKNEALRKDLQTIDEREAYFRVVTRLAGSESLCFPKVKPEKYYFQ